MDQIRDQFLIISQPRSGTQMLEQALSAHPAVSMRTWSTSQDNPHLIMDLYRFPAASDVEINRRFRGFVTHVWDEAFTRKEFGMALDKYWRILSYFFPVNRVVVLTRKNQLRRFLSYKVSEFLGNWGVYEPRWEHPTVEFDFEEFLAWLHDTMVHTESVLRAFPWALRLTYEGLVKTWKSTWARLLDYLGIPHIGLALTTCRQEFRSVGEIINLTSRTVARFEHYGMEVWLK